MHDILDREGSRNRRMSTEHLKPFQFKSGEPSANPGGRPKLPEEIKQAKKLNQIELERIFNEALYFTKEELAERRGNPKTTVLEHVVYSILSIANNKGDHQRLEFIFQRLLGKTPQVIKISNPDGSNLSLEDRRVQIFNLLKDEEGRRALNVISRRLIDERKSPELSLEPAVPRE